MKRECRICSFNLFSGGAADWPWRRDAIAEMIRFYRVDAAGFQELTWSRLGDLAQRLPEYDFWGAGREDGQRAGEWVPCFFRKERFELVDKGNFWLSPKSHLPSKGWDASLPRMATYVRLVDAASSQRFLLLNTHLDYRGAVSRRCSASLLVEKAQVLAQEEPVILTGDFNCGAHSPPYKVLTCSSSQHPPFRDAETVAGLGCFGWKRTWQAWHRWDWPGRRIDFIFFRGGVDVVRYGVLPARWNGKLVSDHRPVLADVVWQEKEGGRR